MGAILKLKIIILMINLFLVKTVAADVLTTNEIAAFSRPQLITQSFKYLGKSLHACVIDATVPVAASAVAETIPFSSSFTKLFNSLLNDSRFNINHKLSMASQVASIFGVLSLAGDVSAIILDVALDPKLEIRDYTYNEFYKEYFQFIRSNYFVTKTSFNKNFSKDAACRQNLLILSEISEEEERRNHELLTSIVDNGRSRSSAKEIEIKTQESVNYAIAK
jgi:hypothetical protein